MKHQLLKTVSVTAILALFLGAVLIFYQAPAVKGAAPPLQNGVISVSAVVESKISYQGVLKEGGNSVTGTRNMTFRFYSDNGCSTQVGSDVVKSGVSVTNGVFNVQLDVDPNNFQGQALWLGVDVGNTGSNIVCQELTPAPYTLGLRPGATINNTATGFAIRGESANGQGVFGYSDDNYGVIGQSDNSWGGYFSSAQGYGIRVETTGSDHYDHAAYITAQNGYGVYAQSANNMAVRGEAGDISGVSQPLGPVGVVGLGQNRGVVGASASGSGVYASSDTNYGVWGESGSYRGVTGRTGRADDNYGFYTPDNLFSKNYNLRGAIMLVAQNGGKQPLETGDVVVFSGVRAPEKAGDPPTVQVAKATTANSAAVAGVVFSRFNIKAVDEAADNPAGSPTEREPDVTPKGAALPGDYLLLVIQGAAQVKVSALNGDISPGDLLSTSETAGYAAADSALRANNAPGAVFGKALAPLAAGNNELLYVFVTLN